MTFTLRPPAVPLVTVDPYFNVWSSNDHLFDDHTHHWTFQQGGTAGIHGMMGMIRIDGKAWRFMGKLPQTEHGEEQDYLQQVALTVDPLNTIYTFEGAGITLQVEFMTPLLLDNLDILSRPASYITFDVWSNDGNLHDVQIYFDVTGEWCVHEPTQQVNWSRVNLGGRFESMKMGSLDQPILGRKGDDTRIDWGYLHLVVSDTYYGETVIHSMDIRRTWMEQGSLPKKDDTQMPRSVEGDCPVMAAVLDFGMVTSEKKSDFLVLAYDDIVSIEYFHQQLPGYWKRDGLTMGQMLLLAIREYPTIKKACARFNKKLKEKATKLGGDKYRDMVSLAYRQAIAAHKLVLDEKGDLLFLSKENNSNGCIGTVDISYPSAPLFLLYNPALVKGMMRPIFCYARSDEWPFDFAPHDVGTYPIANGQVYGENAVENQMPIEECGNIIIMMTAVCLAEGKTQFAEENWDLLTQWAKYLRRNGLDPGHQLCTDDFAGHLAHNANLSIKAIIGVGSYGILCGLLGKAEEKEDYLHHAQLMAREWEEMADDNDHFKLTFDQSGTWSLKYNLIWDNLFSLNLFSDEVKQKEVNYYLARKNRYGTPLDSRQTYTKADWLVWAAALAEREEDRLSLIEPLWHFLNETEDRVPFTDWYDTKTAKRLNFKNRSVVGGLFILLLTRDWIKN
ncbi:glutaminase domain-containing protein [Gracilibacillus dipsosauri]|uniref:glutaminase domain-containing protein n=1 Tax=Gracilibacillus dipsosauri TaxID=178340 RepID=UPI002409C3F1